MWQRTWFDSAARQTRRASLGTADRATAERALVGWISGNAAAAAACRRRATASARRRSASALA
jgi:hypothetical protein